MKSVKLTTVLSILFVFALAQDTHAGVVYDAVDTGADPVLLTGTSTESGSTITNVEFQTNGTGGSWTSCTAADGTFDSGEEGFACTLGTLSDGDYTIYVRTTANIPLGFQATTSVVGGAGNSATSDSNNLYVTGSCDGCGTLGGDAYYTIAYSKTDGSFVWATTTDLSSNGDYANGITSDSNNLYVTGYCTGCGTLGGNAFYTIAYSKTDGSFVWATTTDPTSGTDYAYAITSDSNNLYVTGSCNGCGTLGGNAFYTIAYSKTDGSFVWATTTDPTSGFDIALGITSDSNNLYVTGRCDGCGTLGGNAFYTIAYSKTDGSFVWATTTDPTSGWEQGQDITSDSNNLYVTGYCTGCGTLGSRAYHTIAYDKSDGSFVWATTTDPTSGFDYADGITSDSNNLYVTGTCAGCGTLGGDALYTIAYSKTDGSYVWATTTDPTSAGDNAYAITSDSNNLYVTGSINNFTSLFTIAYDKATGNTYTSGADTDNIAFTIDPPPSSSSQGTRVGSRSSKLIAPPIEITVGTPTIESLTKKLNELRTQLNELLATTGGSGGGGSHVYLTDLTIGSTHPDVSRLQRYLVSLGRLTMPEGVSYGYFGTLTEAALAQFQSDNNINPPQGYFGPITRAFLNR